jgi:hypothetical protein
MAKNNAASTNPANRTGASKLEHCYGDIGISALVAALRFVSCAGNEPKQPASSQKEDEPTREMAA